MPRFLLCRVGFRCWLASEGYASKPVELHLALFSHVSCWLGGRGLGSDELTATSAEEFLEERRRCYTWFTTTRSLSPLLSYLRSIDVLANDPVSVPASAADRLVETYRCFLERERGLAVGSIELYLVQVRRFVSLWWPSGEVDPAVLDAPGVIGLVAREASRLSVPSAKTLVCALRSFLRFLHAAGMTQRPLADAVPSVSDRRRASIPRNLDPDVVTQLIASCDMAAPS